MAYIPRLPKALDRAINRPPISTTPSQLETIPTVSVPPTTPSGWAPSGTTGAGWAPAHATTETKTSSGGGGGGGGGGTYDSSTSTYTDSSGSKMSMAQPPASATVLTSTGEVSTATPEKYQSIFEKEYARGYGQEYMGSTGGVPFYSEPVYFTGKQEFPGLGITYQGKRPLSTEPEILTAPEGYYYLTPEGQEVQSITIPSEYEQFIQSEKSGRELKASVVDTGFGFQTKRNIAEGFGLFAKEAKEVAPRLSEGFRTQVENVDVINKKLAGGVESVGLTNENIRGAMKDVISTPLGSEVETAIESGVSGLVIDVKENLGTYAALYGAGRAVSFGLKGAGFGLSRIPTYGKYAAPVFEYGAAGAGLVLSAPFAIKEYSEISMMPTAEQKFERIGELGGRTAAFGLGFAEGGKFFQKEVIEVIKPSSINIPRRTARFQMEEEAVGISLGGEFYPEAIVKVQSSAGRFFKIDPKTFVIAKQRVTGDAAVFKIKGEKFVSNVMQFRLDKGVTLQKYSEIKGVFQEEEIGANAGNIKNYILSKMPSRVMAEDTRGFSSIARMSKGIGGGRAIKLERQSKYSKQYFIPMRPATLEEAPVGLSYGRFKQLELDESLSGGFKVSIGETGTKITKSFSPKAFGKIDVEQQIVFGKRINLNLEGNEFAMFKGQKIKTLYHGTTEGFAKDMLGTGLKPGTFVTIDEATARGFAGRAVAKGYLKGLQEKPAVLKIRLTEEHTSEL